MFTFCLSKVILNHPFFQLLASSSVADLILFVYQSHTILSLELSSHIALLNRLRKSSRVEFKVSSLHFRRMQFG